MILKALTLENFKGIREPVRIEFAPLTLLFGPNNAGKSTIVQALIYAREIFERNNADARRTQLGGDVIDLGGFKNLVHRHEVTRTIRMRFELEGVDLPGYLDSETEENIETNLRGAQFPGDDRSSCPTVDEVSAEMAQLWVQVEIAWSARLTRPVVKCYQVGMGGEPYAVVELSDDGITKISSIAYDAHPFGSKEISYSHELDLADRPGVLEAMDLEDLEGMPRSYRAIGPYEDPPAPVWWEGKLRKYETKEYWQIDGWLPFWLRTCVEGAHAKIPFRGLRGSYDAIQLPLQLKDTALPDWGRLLPIPPRVWAKDIKERSATEPDHAAALDYLAGILTSIITGPGERLMEALRKSVYLSPFREMPPRHYRPVHPLESRRWANGLAAWDLLMLKGAPLVAAVNDWLAGARRLNAAYRIGVTQYKELDVESPLMAALNAEQLPADPAWVRQQIQSLPEGQRLTIWDTRNDLALCAQDLGVGISQVVPVLVAALHNIQGIVAIEEPESNIHPAFQVVLADLFITQAKANPDVLFLVETHSEHLMLRCLRRIRETTKGLSQTGDVPSVTPEEVAVHFVEPCADGPRIHRIEIDGEGDFLDPWPQGFFRERVKELYGDDL